MLITQVCRGIIFSKKIFSKKVNVSLLLFNSPRVLIVSLLNIIFLGCILCAAEQSCAGEIEEYTYLECSGTERSSLTWRLVKNDTVKIYVNKETVSFFNECRPSGATLRWQMKSADVDLSARRKGNSIHIKGRLHEKQVDNHYAIDGDPWYQPMSYSLRRLATSKNKETAFWIIRLDTFCPAKMKAVRKGRETVAFGENEVPARHIQVRLTGMWSFFWHGDYWYRENDGLFLKYEGMNGPPGSAKTLIQLQK